MRDKSWLTQLGTSHTYFRGLRRVCSARLISKLIKLNSFDSVCLFHVPSDKNCYFEAFLVMMGASCQFVVSRLGPNHLSNLTNIDNVFCFLQDVLPVLYLLSNLDIYSGCRHLWFDLKLVFFVLDWPQHFCTTQLT